MDTITPEQLARLPLFDRNRMAISIAEWQRHIGQWVAISPDGGRITAGDADPHRLEAKLVELGVNVEEVLFEFVEEPGNIYLWG